MWVVVDHISGSRQGQRQELELELGGKLRIGRHPDCDIGFDGRRDLEASTRHAELRATGERLVLRDVGSSNGTYVGGARINEIELAPSQTTEAQFGARGPRLRIWWSPEPDPDAVPPLPRAVRRRWTILASLAVALVVAVALAIALGR